MQHIPYVISDDTITLCLKGVPYTLDTTHHNFDAIITHLRERSADADTLLKLVSIPTAIEALKIGKVTVGTDAVFYDGKIVHSHLTERMLDLITRGLDVTPWAKFMERLYDNPSKIAVDELYLWLEQSRMPITEDGCFLAYKKVKD